MGDLLEFMLVAGPILAVIGGAVYFTRRKLDGLRMSLAEERGANKTAQIASEKMALEERVRVLETIVTSRGYSIAEEIEALRQNPALENNSEKDRGVPLNIKSQEKA